LTDIDQNNLVLPADQLFFQVKAWLITHDPPKNHRKGLISLNILQGIKAVVNV